MPEGRPRDDQTPPLRILEHWRRVAWPGRGNWPHRDPSISSIGFECSALGGRHGAQNLIVVAAGKNRFEERWASCKIFRAVLESGTPAVATSAVIPVRRNIFARSPANPSEMSMAACAWARSAARRQRRGRGRKGAAGEIGSVRLVDAMGPLRVLRRVEAEF